ncbi:MAG: flagellar hook-length control protein FliK [Gammaproteobacteria bacterium]|nr:flagellar hook-length control protein FliK [Gammaproteobacteria bacterium]
MTSVSLNGVAGLLGAPLTMALDAGSQVPGGSPQGVASEALDGFQKLLAQHINNINKKLQLAENKELNINFSMENLTVPITPEAIASELLANGIGVQAATLGQLEPGSAGGPASSTLALALGKPPVAGEGKELPAGGEALPTIAGVPGEGAGVFGSESGMAKPGADTLPLAFAAMRTLAQSGRDILAQLAAASGRTEDDLLRDPRALLQAAAAMATPAALSAAEARLPTPDRGALAGQGAMGETVVAGIESRNAADAGTSPALVPAIAGAAGGSRPSINAGAAELAALDSLAAVVQRTQVNTAAAAAPVAGAGGGTAAAPGTPQQTAAAIPLEPMIAGRNEQGAGLSRTGADQRQSSGATKESGRDRPPIPVPGAPGLDQAQRHDAVALSAARLLHDTVARASDPKVTAEPAPLHGAGPLHAVPAPRLDSVVAGAATVAALPLASGAWGELLGERIRWLSTGNMDTADIHLDPPELGPLQVKVQAHRDGTSVQFTTHSAVVRDMVEQSLPRLREMLEGSGMNLLDVNVAQHQDGGGQGRREALADIAPYAEPLLALDPAAGHPAAARPHRGLVDYYA